MSRTMVQLRGGKGLSAAEQAFLAGQIAEPTQAALDAFLRAPALAAADQAGADVDALIAATGEAFGQEKAALDIHVAAKDALIDDKLDSVDGVVDVQIARVDGAVAVAGETTALAQGVVDKEVATLANIEAAKILVQASVVFAGSYEASAFQAANQATSLFSSLMTVAAAGRRAFTTLAEANSIKATLPDGFLAEVVDTASADAGTYLKKGADLVMVSQFSLSSLGARVANTTPVDTDPASSGPLNFVPFYVTAASDDPAKVINRAGYDPVTGSFFFDKLISPDVSFPNLPAGGQSLFVSKALFEGAGGLSSVVGNYPNDTIGEARGGPGEGLHLRSFGTWNLLTPSSLKTLGMRAAATAPVTNTSGIQPIIVAPDSADPDNTVVNLAWLASDGLLHLSSAFIHSLSAPGFNKAAAPIATPSVLKDSGGAIVSVSTNDNDGQRRYNPFSDPNTWYVFGWAGQSLNGGQASLLHNAYGYNTPPDPSAPNYAAFMAIYNRTYAPLTTIEQNLYPANLLMPNVGSNIVGLTAGITGFVPLVCYNKVPFGTLTQSGETPETQALYTMMALHRADFPNDPVPTFIAINYAVGSSSILNLGPGRPAWTDMQAAVQKIVDLATAANKRVVFVSEHYRGFEADWDIPRHADLANSDPADPTIINGRERETLMRALANRRAQLDEYIRPITGQGSYIRLATDQVQIGASSYTASREPRATGAQLDLHMFEALCISLGSKGAIPANILDFIHPSPHGYNWMGRFDGYLLYRHFCIVEGHQPLKAYRFKQTGALTYQVIWNRHARLLADDTVVNVTDLGAGKGLQIVDSNGTVVPIASVVMTSVNVTTITLAGAYAGFGPPRLNISLVSSGNRRGNKTGARSAIVSYAPLGYMPAPPTFPGEVNDEGTPWPVYPNPLPIYEMAAHQQIALT
ncbi:hypothetical protein [Sphingomonas faeni]|uniref:hypothetical protein n=1 Tax=Sphingomonas faeni TaxID=185950 RepID=UPI00335E5A73